MLALSIALYGLWFISMGGLWFWTVTKLVDACLDGHFNGVVYTMLSFLSLLLIVVANVALVEVLT